MLHFHTLFLIAKYQSLRTSSAYSVHICTCLCVHVHPTCTSCTRGRKCRLWCTRVRVYGRTCAQGLPYMLTRVHTHAHTVLQRIFFLFNKIKAVAAILKQWQLVSLSLLSLLHIMPALRYSVYSHLSSFSRVLALLFDSPMWILRLSTLLSVAFFIFLVYIHVSQSSVL